MSPGAGRAPAPAVRPRRLGRTGTIGIAAILFGGVAALREAWLCDDAFISFRYAENFLAGLGLVYNPGERVEGYSNFLWTLWTAAGMRFGAAPESWSIAWGVACYVASLALLVWNRARLGRRFGGAALGLPVAALIGAVHLDWSIYATSGLETSCFAMLGLLAWLLAVHAPLGLRGAAAAGMVAALAAMTRPDGVIFVPLIAAYLCFFRPPGLRSALVFGAMFLLAWAPYVAWKISYYGDFFPNTYYAKSAALAWYSQGWIYVRFYFAKYGAVLLGLPLVLTAAFVPRWGEGGGAERRAWLGEVALALAIALGYTFYVLRVGGDFMFARLLIPATPFFLLLFDLALVRLGERRPLLEGGVAVAALAATLALPHPLPDAVAREGIFNERMVYRPEHMAVTRKEGGVLRRYFEGLPVRMAFVGSQAALVYYAKPAVAIEGQTGLTDAWIARQPLERRGRVGHEKAAPPTYIVDERKVHFTVHHFPGVVLRLNEVVPLIALAFDQVPARIVHWDPAVLAEVERRGAVLQNFPRMLDEYLAGLDQLSDAQVREDYPKFRRFYFAQVNDPAREAPFLARLGPAAEARRR